MIISSHENHGPVLAGISDSGTMREMRGSPIEQARNTIPESFTRLRGSLSDCIEFILNHPSFFGLVLVLLLSSKQVAINLSEEDGRPIEIPRMQSFTGTNY